MLSVVKMLLKGEVGGCALNSHRNYFVDHGKSWNNHGIVFLNFCGNPEYLYFCCFYSSSTAFDELHGCVGKILDQFSHNCYDRDDILRNGIMHIAQKSFVAVPVQACFCEYTTCIKPFDKPFATQAQNLLLA